MFVLKALDEALDEAEDSLNADAEFRLSEILVNEVSVVDRPANKRPFLVVKRQGEDSMTKPTQITLTRKAKEGLAGGLTENLNRLVQLSEAVKGAKTDDDHKDGLSSELVEVLRDTLSGITKLFLEHGVTKGVGSVAESLVQVAEMSMMLAEQVASEGEVDAEVTARMKQLAKLLETVAAKGDDEGESTNKGDEGGEGEDDASEDDASEGGEGEDDASEDAADEGGEGEDDASEGDEGEDAGGSASVDDAEKSNDSIAALTEQVSNVTQNLSTLTELVTSLAKPKEDVAPASKKSEVEKQLDAIKQENASLKKKLQKAEEEPPSRASGGGSTDVSKNGGRRIFPAVYNDSLHDPAPEA